MGKNIIRSCETHIANHAGNCSGFVKAVAADFGVKLEGRANDIYKDLSNRERTVKYGVGVTSSLRAAHDAAETNYLVIGASYNETGPGHVAIVTGQDSKGRVLVYGGMLDHPEKASKNIPITSKCWAAYKLKHCYVAKEPPAFFGIPLAIPYSA